jgi:hypothetical protein
VVPRLGEVVKDEAGVSGELDVSGGQVTEPAEPVEAMPVEGP